MSRHAVRKFNGRWILDYSLSNGGMGPCASVPLFCSVCILINCLFKILLCTALHYYGGVNGPSGRKEEAKLSNSNSNVQTLSSLSMLTKCS